MNLPAFLRVQLGHDGSRPRIRPRIQQDLVVSGPSYPGNVSVFALRELEQVLRHGVDGALHEAVTGRGGHGVLAEHERPCHPVEARIVALVILDTHYCAGGMTIFSWYPLGYGA